MDALRRLGTVLGRMMRWSLSAVEDDLPTNVIPMPGPAHGPIPAIDLKVEARRRRAS